jgi:glycosyltransferase involved in cell wall biosynthesis
MSSPQVSVLIPAYNEEALIARVIASVVQSFSAIPDRSYEIIVCDNNSTDRTAEIAAMNGAKVVAESHNQIARARNTAAKAAKGNWFIFLDADTLLNTELLDRTLNCLASGEVVGGGATVAFDKVIRSPFAYLLTHVWTTISVVFRLAAGSYIFCTREAWAGTGGFDEQFYAGEELFFSKKLKKWGRRRAQRFTIIAGAPVVTSARKLEWFNQWQLLTRMLVLALPGALKRRDRCDLWYSRPAE